VIGLLLDLANTVGGFILAIMLLRRLPRVGDDLLRAKSAIAPYAWIVGIVALVTGGYYLIVHLTSGPHVFHFELIAIAVGVVLLWERLTGRSAVKERSAAAITGRSGTGLTGGSLLVAVLGVIAIIVGIQGLFTPD
jgi:hypothetical protein